MRDYLVEVCCGSAEDVIHAERGGADRVELCSNLFQGGLTPTQGAYVAARERTKIPINVMIRPREGGFCYTESEMATALHDAQIFAEVGVDGLVCGFLKEDGTVDAEKTKALVEIAGDIPVTFHRAIDVVPDWREALDTLAECGVKRVLTSGQKPSVLLAIDTIREMREYAKDRLIIMAGAGIKVDTADLVAEKTGCKELHVHFTKLYQDFSTLNNPAIHFGSALYPSETHYPVIDAEAISKLK